MTARLAVGFAGCGEVAAEKHMPALTELGDIEVVAAADHDPARLRYVAQRFGVRHRYADVSALLAHPGLEVVVACLPPAMQVGVATAALDAGKHLWIDPPVGLTLADCDRLIARARSVPQTVTVGFHMRWHRLIQQARAIVQSGRLGRIHSIRAVWNSPREDETLPAWRRSRVLGGGTLFETAPEQFDLFFYLLGSEIDELMASTLDGRWDDEAAVLSGRLTSGTLVSIVLSERASHEVEYEITGTLARLRVSCMQFDGLQLYPTHVLPGSADARLRRLGHFLRELPRAIPRMHRLGDYRLSYQAQWRHVARCIRDGAPVECTLADGRRALAATLAAAASAQTRRPVTVADAPSALAVPGAATP
jgi:predicted dehydrogenase